MDHQIFSKWSPIYIENVHPNAGESSDHTPQHGQTLAQPPGLLSTSNCFSVVCPECKEQYGRTQELQRHILSAHLPAYLYCPHTSCSWRGDRSDKFRKHLRVQHPGSDPKHASCYVYDTRMIFDWIKEGVSLEIAARYALGLVSEKAHELGFVKEWEDLWGPEGKKVHRRLGTGMTDQ